MVQYKKISNLGMIRKIGKAFPLKSKLNFLIKRYLHDNTKLAIRYTKDWYICTTVTGLNRSTIQSLILEGTYSQPEVALINQLKGSLPSDMVLVDVGGNIGSFFCQLLEKCRQVYVFEPIPRLNQVISQSIVFNNNKKTTLIQKAVGEEQGVVKMLDNNNSSIVDDSSQESVLEITVSTLDTELKDVVRIDFIKIDVEGYEMQVLRGAKEIINKHRPSFLVEVHPIFLQNYHSHHSEVIRFFEEANYRIEYFSFLEELRMSRTGRIISRWKGNKGIHFADKESFLKDVLKTPHLSSYHFFCEPD